MRGQVDSGQAIGLGLANKRRSRRRGRPFERGAATAGRVKYFVNLQLKLDERANWATGSAHRGRSLSRSVRELMFRPGLGGSLAGGGARANRQLAHRPPAFRSPELERDGWPASQPASRPATLTACDPSAARGALATGCQRAAVWAAALAPARGPLS